MAAIAMEEVLPSSVADAEALAPEELYKKKRGREAEFLEGNARARRKCRSLSLIAAFSSRVETDGGLFSSISRLRLQERACVPLPCPVPLCCL